MASSYPVILPGRRPRRSKRAGRCNLGSGNRGWGRAKRRLDRPRGLLGTAQCLIFVPVQNLRADLVAVPQVVIELIDTGQGLLAQPARVPGSCVGLDMSFQGEAPAEGGVTRTPEGRMASLFCVVF